MRGYWGRFLFPLCLLAGLSASLLQGQRHLSGTGREAGSRSPLAYVNIGLEGLSVGTVTDEQGTFRLFVPETASQPGAMLRISSLGYATVRLPFEGMQEEDPLEIFLQPEAIAL